MCEIYFPLYAPDGCEVRLPYYLYHSLSQEIKSASADTHVRTWRQPHKLCCKHTSSRETSSQGMLDFICYHYLRSLKFRDSSFSSPPESFSQSCTRLSKAASLSPREAVFFSVFSPSQLQTNMMWCFTEWRLWKLQTTWLTVRHFTSLQKSTTQPLNSVVLFFTLRTLNGFLFQYSGLKKVKHLFWKDTEVKLDRNPVFIPARISW